MSKPVELTQEQYNPIASTSRKIVIKALAGTGKSTVLRAFCHFNKSLRILYLVFNSDNAVAARKSFPSNVKCLTFHSLAWQSLGYKYGNAKKVRNLTLTALRDHLNIQDWTLLNYVKATVLNYIYSADDQLDNQHIPNNLDFMYKSKGNAILNLAKQAWAMVGDLDHPMPCPHDGYFKLWMQTKPQLDFDVVMVDEGQDSNMISLALLKQLNNKLIVVGDEHQQLYGFRESVNILQDKFFSDAEIFPLTQSFRFGVEVAKVANVILYLLSSNLRVKGTPQIPSVVMNGADDAVGHEGKPYQLAFISRTVFGTIESALNLTGTNKLTYWVGSINNYNLDALSDLYYFSINDAVSIRNPKALKEYSTYAEYMNVAEASSDGEMTRAVRLVKTYGARLPALVQSLKDNATEDRGRADFVVTTAHRAKGLEFEHARLTGDFRNPYLDLLEIKKVRNGALLPADIETFRSEMYILYVAVTRAIYRLDLNDTLKELISTVSEKIKAKKQCKA